MRKKQIEEEEKKWMTGKCKKKTKKKKHVTEPLNSICYATKKLKMANNKKKY